MTTKARRLLVGVVILIAGASWFGVRKHRCKLRGETFDIQIETIKRDAAQELRVGANKAEVARFFTAHNIPFAMIETGAFGTLRTSGCAPLGCGTDRAFIGVKVRFDVAGIVTDAPEVFGMYQDCL